MQVQTTINIDEHCAALFATQASQTHFLGSSFFFSQNGVVLAATADHCIGQHNNGFHMVCAKGIFFADIAHRDAARDLCILKPRTHPENIHAELNRGSQVASNTVLHVYEFSTTEVTPHGYSLSPATRIGNCIRLVDRESQFGRAGLRMLELSFPALKGASGSAVVELRNGGILIHGVLVANVQHHLLPAQIETVLDEKNSLLEERKYFLPQGAAVNSLHLSALVEMWQNKNRVAS